VISAMVGAADAMLKAAVTNATTRASGAHSLAYGNYLRFRVTNVAVAM